jgi:hypothetical protein
MLRDLAITGGVAVLLLIAFLAVQVAGSGDWGISGALHIEGLLLMPDGQLVARPGQMLTATFRLRNQADHVGTLTSFQIGVRGPQACADGWRGRNQDFHSESVVLAAGSEHLYQESRTFETPGDYFAEPVKLENGKWGGIGPYPRIWFTVVPTGTTWVPPTACLALTPTVQPTVGLRSLP